MRVIRAKELDFVPASHEDQSEPGVLKKVLLRKHDLIDGQVQMINWALLPAGKSFRAHYHEDMEEVFVIIKGRARITVDEQEEEMEAGDAVVIPFGCVHEMKNIGQESVEYVVVGVSQGTRGKTVVV
jgi:mannose-6-phosphate isomerase-like protein (cupin superfamily)